MWLEMGEIQKMSVSAIELRIGAIAIFSIGVLLLFWRCRLGGGWRSRIIRVNRGQTSHLKWPWLIGRTRSV